jgi:hypothetical protein
MNNMGDDPASGTKCEHAIGTELRVTYTQHKGIKKAQRVELAAW